MIFLRFDYLVGNGGCVLEVEVVMRVIWFCILSGLYGFCVAAGDPRIELVSGAIVEAPVIRRAGGDLFVDLGFEIIRVPGGSVARVVEETETVELGAVDGSLHVSELVSGAEIAPVSKWVERIGSAVVTVQTPIGLGSGFFVDASGLLVTNNHVVSGEREISVVVLAGDAGNRIKKVFENVRIVATNPAFDLALLEVVGVDEASVVTVAIGDSGELVEGQEVFAIGSPLGLERSVSQGIVSNRNRPVGGLIYVQSTAEISPGNSGGPLFNLRGQVVGVNNMKVVAVGAEGLGFAIPSAVLKLFLDNRDAFAFDPRNPNSGFRYNPPPFGGVR